MGEGQPAPGKRLLLAYAGSSAALVKPLHRAFEAAGFVVDTAPDDQPRSDHPIDTAHAVIVCWTPAAVASDGVNLQAARAQKARKLMPILLAPCSPPGSLGGLRATDLSGWRGDPTDKEFRELVQALHGRLSGGMLGSLLSGNVLRSRYFTWGSAGAAALGAIAIITNFGDLRQTIDGFTNPGASEKTLLATNDNIVEVLTLMKQQSTQPLSAETEAALRGSIERLLSAQSGARGTAAERLAMGDINGALTELQSAADEGEKAAQALAETWKEIGALRYAFDTHAAIAAYTRAAELAPQDSDANNLLGTLYMRTGDYEEALRRFERVSWFEEDEAKRAIALGNLGIVALAKGDEKEADRLFRESLGINEKLGNKKGQAADLADLSKIVRLQGNPSRADQMLQQALKFYTEIGDQAGQSTVHASMGAVALERDQITQARKSFSTAADIADASGDMSAMIYAQAGLGNVAFASDKFAEARDHYAQMLNLAQAISAREQEAEGLYGLGDVARELGDKTIAIERYRDAMMIYRDIVGADGKVSELADLIAKLGGTPSPEGPEN